MIWPIADVNVYKFGHNKEGRFPGLAPVRVAGFVERSYSEDTQITHTAAGSRFYAIGGTFYRVGVRKRANIRISEVSDQKRKDAIIVQGSVGPARDGQRILVDVLLPDGKTHRRAETRTKPSGQFQPPVGLLDENRKLQPGPYRVQAFIFHASELADAESNVIYVTR